MAKAGRPSKTQSSEIAKRNETIVKLRKDRVSYQFIGNMFGLSRFRVYQICKKYSPQVK